MRISIAIFILVLSSCRGTEKSSQNKQPEDRLEKIDVISFKFEHSLRIPFYKVSIEITKRYKGIYLELHSSPKDGFKNWENTRIDTTFLIDANTFNKVLNSVRKISSQDLESSLVSGEDGTSCEIRYGNFQNAISYLVWTPGLDSATRKTEDFLMACKEIIIAAKLDPNKIL